MASSFPIHRGSVSSTPIAKAKIEELLGISILDGQRLDIIEGVTTWDTLIPNRMLFAERVDDRIVTALNGEASQSLVIATAEYKTAINAPRLITRNPRQSFAKIVRALFPDRFTTHGEAIHPTAQIHATAQLCYGVVIGANSFIGEGTTIYPNVVISSLVYIGAHCIIGSGTVIGQPGFGIYRDEEGLPQHFPHVGGVVIGDHVELGALNTVVGGTIHPTVVEDYVKTDDHVHIAHNCHVGARTLLTACAELSGSVRLGMDCWVGPNSSLRDGIEIGDRTMIGIGSVVTKSFASDMTVYGVPAKSSAK